MAIRTPVSHLTNFTRYCQTFEARYNNVHPEFLPNLRDARHESHDLYHKLAYNGAP